MTTGTDDRKEMTSTTQVPLSVDTILSAQARKQVQEALTAAQETIGGAISVYDVESADRARAEIRAALALLASLPAVESLTEGQAAEEWMQKATRLTDELFEKADNGEAGLCEREELLSHLRKRIASPQPAPAPAHSKSEYKRRVAQGDENVLPPAPEMTDARIEELHAAIMNLPCCPPRGTADQREHEGVPEAILRAYIEGHRDARHAAAELASAQKDGAEALLLKVYQQMELLMADSDIIDEVRTYLEGK